MAGEIEESYSFNFQIDTLHSGSISFGRFTNESLSWERRSSFTHNRYLEEVEKCSKPGLVTEKKAYFEAHFKKKALLSRSSSEGENNHEGCEVIDHGRQDRKDPGHESQIDPTFRKVDVTVMGDYKHEKKVVKHEECEIIDYGREDLVGSYCEPEMQPIVSNVAIMAASNPTHKKTVDPNPIRYNEILLDSTEVNLVKESLINKADNVDSGSGSFDSLPARREACKDIANSQSKSKSKLNATSFENYLKKTSASENKNTRGSKTVEKSSQISNSSLRSVH